MDSISLLEYVEEKLRDSLEDSLSIDEVLENIEVLADDIKGWLDIR